MQRLLTGSLFVSKASPVRLSTFRAAKLNNRNVSFVNVTPKGVPFRKLCTETKVVEEKPKPPLVEPVAQQKPADVLKETESEIIPRAALALSCCAYSPLVVGSAVMAFASPPTAALASVLQLTYGAAFLGILGGIPWGCAITNYSRVGITPTEQQNAVLYSLGLLPPLMAWSCLLQPPKLGLLALVGGYGMTLFIDTSCHGMGRVPAWWTRLKFPMTLLLMLTLLIAFFYMPEVKVVELIALGHNAATQAAS